MVSTVGVSAFVDTAGTVIDATGFTFPPWWCVSCVSADRVR